MNKIKILFVLLGMCLAIPSFAQNKSKAKTARKEKPHLVFMDTPIVGTIAEFADKLTEKHPELQEETRNDSVIVLKGKYYLFDESEILISKSKISSDVGCVMVAIFNLDEKDKSNAINLYIDLSLKYKEVEAKVGEVLGVATAVWETKRGKISWIMTGDTTSVIYTDYAEIERENKMELEKIRKKKEVREKASKDI